MSIAEGSVYFWPAMVRHRKLVIKLTGGCAVLALLVSLVLPKHYRAVTSLLFPARQQAGLAGLLGQVPGQQGEGMPGFPQLGGMVNISLPGSDPTTCQAILSSRTIRKDVIEQLKLLPYLGTDRMAEGIRRLDEATDIQITPAGTLELSVEAKNPKLAADIANRYIECLRAQTKTLTRGDAYRSRVFIAGQLEKNRRALGRAQEALRRFQESHRVVSVPDQAKGELDAEANLLALREQARAELAAAQAQLGAVRKLVRSQARKAMELPAQSPLIQDWRKKLVDLESQLVLARRMYGPSHRVIRDLTGQVGEAKRQIRAEAGRVLRSVDAGVAPETADLVAQQVAGQARVQALDQSLAELAQRRSKLPAAAAELAGLERELGTQQAVYNMLSQEFEKARLMEAREVVDFEVLDRAAPPDRKFKPKISLNTLGGGMIGLLAGMMIALWKEGKVQAREVKG